MMDVQEVAVWRMKMTSMGRSVDLAPLFHQRQSPESTPPWWGLYHCEAAPHSSELARVVVVLMVLVRMKSIMMWVMQKKIKERIRNDVD